LDVMPFAVYSDDSEREVLDKYGVRSLKFENRPLGRKKNAGLAALLEMEWDYMMELGSDDIVNPALMEVYQDYFDRGVPCFGVRSCYQLELSSGRVALFEIDYPIGAGRCISRKVFDAMGRRWRVRYLRSTNLKGENYGKGKELVYIEPVSRRLVESGLCEKVCDEHDPPGLWTDTKELGLDADSMMNLNMNGWNVDVVDVDPMIVDIKTEDNLHRFDGENECEGVDLTWLEL